MDELRAWMRQQGIGAFIFPSTDAHCGEYVPDYWQTRAWISGFDGSAGTAVVTLTEAALWTDSRYWLAAETLFKNGSWQLMKEGKTETPDIATWISEHIDKNFKVVGVDAWVNTETALQKYRESFQKNGIRLETGFDPAALLWKDRPALPSSPLEIQPEEYAGKSVREKLTEIREAAHLQEGSSLLVGVLDEIAWTLNLRGKDVHCTPVFVSYLMILDGKNADAPEAILYVNPQKLTPEIKDYLQVHHIETHRYDTIQFEGNNTVCYDPNRINGGILQTLKEQNKDLTFKTLTAPIPALRAVKTTAEVEGFKRAMIREGVALVKLLRWLPAAVQTGKLTEMGVDAKLTELRQEGALFKDLSFDTIAGYGAHAAIVHYEATPETDATLEPHGLLLLDCGGQYQDGTTDVTRTIPLGPLTDEERKDYTLVLKGHIRLAMARFPEGTSGTQLDVLARYAMWQDGKNYGHGTGHGIGSFLSCHEGPHQIRMNYIGAPLKANMTVTDEPGLYIAGSHGVRIENTMLIVADGENEYGKWLKMEPLTCCPIATSPIIIEMMTADELAYLNAYHSNVRATLLPLLTDEADKAWLLKATEPLTSNP